MKDKIKAYSALAVATAVVLPMACKKDDPDVDDPDIASFSPNLIVNGIGTTEWAAFDSIDLNSDGTFDFGFYTYAGEDYSGDDYKVTYVYGLRPGDDLVTNTINLAGELTPFCTPKSSGDNVSGSSATFYYYGYLSAQSTDNAFNQGIHGQGDKYIAFRFKAGANTHYGWAKVSVSSDHKQIILKEYAYHTTPGTAIAVGAK